MATVGPYDLDDYAVYHENAEDAELFVMELNSRPAVNGHILYLGVTYKVERVDLVVTETSIPPGAPSGGGSEITGWRTVPKVIVSTVP